MEREAEREGEKQGKRATERERECMCMCVSVLTHQVIDLVKALGVNLMCDHLFQDFVQKRWKLIIETADNDLTKEMRYESIRSAGGQQNKMAKR